MAVLEKKIDFIATFDVKNANPNGDPLSENMPRTDYAGFGEVSDVCIKRKIRNRLQDMGQDIFVQSNERVKDGFKSLEKRFGNVFKGPGKDGDSDEKVYTEACKKWLDVRSFGQVITYQKRSLGIRGPVSIALAKSLNRVAVKTIQITRSCNGMESEKESGRSSDTMGTKSFIEYGVYVIKGSINAFFAEKTGFSEEDALLIKEALKTLFENDMSSARPEGSMTIKEIFWFTHSSKTGAVSTAKIHDLLEYTKHDDSFGAEKYEDFAIHLNEEKLNEYKKLGVSLEYIV